MTAALELEAVIDIFRPTRRSVTLAAISLAVLLVGAVISSDALARRGVVKPKYVLASLRDLVAGLLDRVDAIEKTDCGCPGIVDTVCANGRTYLNFCEAACVLARAGDGDFADLIESGIPRGTELHGGPCEASLPLCGDSVCTAGHICVDGECAVDRCNGFGPRAGPDLCQDGLCPRGFHCADFRETGRCGSHCFCDPETGSTGCTATCHPTCVPDEAG